MKKTYITDIQKLISEWDYDKNKGLSPQKISKGYDKKVWWKCSNGHSFFTSPNTRTGQGVGCPQCRGGVSKRIGAYSLDGEILNVFPYYICCERNRCFKNKCSM